MRDSVQFWQDCEHCDALAAIAVAATGAGLEELNLRFAILFGAATA